MYNVLLCMYYSFVVHSVTAELTGDTSAVKFGDNITLTCTGTGYPEVSVNFDHSSIQAPVVVGEEVVMRSATPTTPSIATRNITIQGVTLSECEAVVQCVANGTVDGTPSTVMSSKTININGTLGYPYLLVPTYLCRYVLRINVK